MAASEEKGETVMAFGEVFLILLAVGLLGFIGIQVGGLLLEGRRLKKAREPLEGTKPSAVLIDEDLEREVFSPIEDAIREAEEAEEERWGIPRPKQPDPIPEASRQYREFSEYQRRQHVLEGKLPPCEPDMEIVEIRNWQGHVIRNVVRSRDV